MLPPLKASNQKISTHTKFKAVETVVNPRWLLSYTPFKRYAIQIQEIADHRNFNYNHKLMEILLFPNSIIPNSSCGL